MVRAASTEGDPGRLRVLFVPGFMQRADAWEQVARIVGERYPSTAVDLLGTTLDERLAEVRASADGAVAIGYSMGGRLALAAAIGETRLAGVVTVGASAGIEADSDRRCRAEADEALAAWIEANPIDAIVERWENLPVFATQAPRLRMAQRRGRLSHDPAALASLLRTAGQGAMASLWDRLPEIACPALFVAGSFDEPYSATAARMAAAVPGGRWEVVEEAGHAPQLEQPERFAALLLEFLDRIAEVGDQRRVDS